MSDCYLKFSVRMIFVVFCDLEFENCFDCYLFLREMVLTILFLSNFFCNLVSFVDLIECLLFCIIFLKCSWDTSGYANSVVLSISLFWVS